MPGKVFINYRRGDAQGSAGRLYDRLSEVLSPSQVFMDVSNLRPGTNFMAALGVEIERSDIVVVIIGPRWLGCPDCGSGANRLHDAGDFVRIELEIASKLEKVIIPVLVDGAQMPMRAMLPEDLRWVPDLHAVRLDHDAFRTQSLDLAASIRVMQSERADARFRSGQAAPLPLRQKGVHRIAGMDVPTTPPPLGRATVAPRPEAIDIGSAGLGLLLSGAAWAIGLLAMRSLPSQGRPIEMPLSIISAMIQAGLMGPVLHVVLVLVTGATVRRMLAFETMILVHAAFFATVLVVAVGLIAYGPDVSGPTADTIMGVVAAGSLVTSVAVGAAWIVSELPLAGPCAAVAVFVCLIVEVAVLIGVGLMFG